MAWPAGPPQIEAVPAEQGPVGDKELCGECLGLHLV